MLLVDGAGALLWWRRGALVMRERCMLKVLLLDERCGWIWYKESGQMGVGFVVEEMDWRGIYQIGKRVLK